MPHDFTGRGIRVFDVMMEEPQLKALFRFRNLNGDALKQNPVFRAHAGRFVQSVSAVVEELESDMATSNSDSIRHMSDWKIGTILNGLGQAHGSIKNLTVKP